MKINKNVKKNSSGAAKRKAIAIKKKNIVKLLAETPKLSSFFRSTTSANWSENVSSSSDFPIQSISSHVAVEKRQEEQEEVKKS